MYYTIGGGGGGYSGGGGGYVEMPQGAPYPASASGGGGGSFCINGLAECPVATLNDLCSPGFLTIELVDKASTESSAKAKFLGKAAAGLL
jgi:hypothetical protein